MDSDILELVKLSYDLLFPGHLHPNHSQQVGHELFGEGAIVKAHQVRTETILLYSFDP